MKAIEVLKIVRETTGVDYEIGTGFMRGVFYIYNPNSVELVGTINFAKFGRENNVPISHRDENFQMNVVEKFCDNL